MVHVAYATAFTGLKTYQIPAIVTNFLDKPGEFERGYLPWKLFMWHMDKIGTILEHRTAFKELRVNETFITNLVYY
jgi:hypothetical protein